MANFDWENYQTVGSDKQFNFDDYEQVPAQKNESLQDKVLRYGVKDPTAGVAQFGNQLLNIPSNVAKMLGLEDASMVLGYKPGYDYSKAVGLPEDQNLADKAIQFLPELMGAFAVPEANLGKAGAALGKIPGVGKFTKKAAQQALPQAGYEGLMSDPDDALQSAAVAGGMTVPFTAAGQAVTSTHPLIKSMGVGGSGLLGYLMGEQLGEAVDAPKGLSHGLGVLGGGLGAKLAMSPKSNLRYHTEGATPENVQEMMDAARRLGLDYLSPSEAAKSPALAARQSELGRSPKGSIKMYERQQARLKSEEKSIDKLMDDIYDAEKLDPEVNRLYKNAKKTPVPEDFADRMKQNKIIEKAAKDIEKDPVYQEDLKGFSDDSLAYWDAVKKALFDMESTYSKRGQNSKAALVKNARKNIVNELDDIDPEYKLARHLAERQKARETIEKVFDKQETKSGTNFYNSLLRSDKKFNELKSHLRDLPTMQDRLDDMRKVFADLTGTINVKGAYAKGKSGVDKHRNITDALPGMIRNMLDQGKLDMELIDFITSPNWDKQLAELNSITNKQKKMEQLLKYMGISSGQVAAEGLKEPFMETENYAVYDS